MVPDGGRCLNREYELGIALDPADPLTLQHQLRRKLVDAIEKGVLPPGRRLPSSRRLAARLGVSRNTVSLAYDALLAEGYLTSQSRSGVFVAAEFAGDRVAMTHRRRVGGERAPAQAEGEDFRRPPNWHQYPYPFLDGCVDSTLVPLDGWREALRFAFGKQELLRWGQGAADADDPALAEELRTRVLPGYGIDASSDEVLVMASPRNALCLAIDALVARGADVFVDDAVDGDIRRRLAERTTALAVLGRDGDGPLVPALLPAQCVVLIGSQRAVSGAGLAPARARQWLAAVEEADALVIECAPPPDLPAARGDALSLRALDGGARAAFIGSLAPAAALGTPPAFISADFRVIERIRRLRRVVGGELAPGMQRAWSHFLALGHYGAAVARSSATLQQRRTELRDALNHYLHKFVRIGAFARSSAYQVSGPAGMDSLALTRAATSLGVLVEPDNEGDRRNLIVMGVTSLPRERIRAGVEMLARLIRRDPALGSRDLREEGVAPLRGRALQRAIAGRTLLYNTVYGDPCTIEVRRDGTLVGSAGYAGEDSDTGRWWVDGDRWVRQWHSWAYGESLALHTIIDGDQVRWFNVDGLLVDTAVIVRA